MKKKHKVERKRYPDLYDNLHKLRSDFSFSMDDIGKAYISFLLARPGSTLNHVAMSSTDPNDSTMRGFKRDFQEATREFFTNLKVEVKYNEANREGLLFVPQMTTIQEKVYYPKGKILTIENVIFDLLEQEDPFATIGEGLCNGSRNYVSFKRKDLPSHAFGSTKYYKLFAEYNRIQTALKKQRSK